MKKAEKSAGASRAKNDKADKGKGAKGKAAAPAAKGKPAKKPEAKDGKDGKDGKGGKDDAKAKGKKGPAKAEPKAAPRAEAKAETKAPAKAKGRGKGKSSPSEAAEASAIAHEAGVAAEAAATQQSLALPEIEETAVAGRPQDPARDDDGADRDGDAGSDAAAPAPLSEEERELSSLYQGELDSPTLAHGEFKDQKTADEDRPMLPEINARDERRRSWEDRRERRRLEREQRRQARRDGHRNPQAGQDRNASASGAHRPQLHGGAAPSHGNQPRPDRNDRNDRAPQSSPDRNDRNDRNERGADRGASPAPQAAPAAALAPSPAAAAPTSGAVAVESGIGHAMATATAALFAQLRNGQPLPVKQLAAMLRKRNLIEGEPDVVWPQLRAELLSDERAYRALGLRPRVVHRGRDLFAPGPTPVESENQLAANVAAIQAATARSLAAWIANASPAAFERLVYSYLLAVGYRDISWVKRVDGIAYAQATAPGLERSVLVSARAGASPIDRRGIGELRVGVEAKNLPFGTLFAAASALSPEAERELERAGRSIGVVCGDALVTALMSVGIGVAATAVTVRFLDEQFLEDLTVG